MKKHDAQLQPTMLDGRHDRAAALFGVTRLETRDTRIVRPDERVVVVEEEMAALDRESQDGMIPARDSPDPMVCEICSSKRRKIGATNVR